MSTQNQRRSAPLLAFRLAVVALLLAPLALAVPGLVDRGAADPESAPHGVVDPPATRPGNEGDPPPVGEPSAGVAAPTRDERPVLGFALVVHHVSDMPLYRRSIDRIAALGANGLNVVTPMFQRYVHSSAIELLPKRCPTDRQLVELLAHARARGLQTTLQPIVLIDRPGEKEWRGVIRPSNWERWWTSYDAFIDRYLDIAEAAQVDVLTIGSELNTTESQLLRWEHVIERVRARFPGPITYSANWDRYDKTSIWRLVDFISVSSYFELQRDDWNASEAALVADWSDRRDRLLAFARDWQRPLMLGEMGYPSLPWATAHPWNYVAPDGQEADHAAQARGYRAFFEAWSDALVDPAAPVRGVFCYHWDPYHAGGTRDTGYGVANKPAEAVIRKAFARLAVLAGDRRDDPDP